MAVIVKQWIDAWTMQHQTCIDHIDNKGKMTLHDGIVELFNDSILVVRTLVQLPNCFTQLYEVWNIISYFDKQFPPSNYTGPFSQ